MNERIRLLAEQAETWNADGDKCEVDLEKFAALVEAAARADEREACIELTDSRCQCAWAIRARGTT